MALNNFDACMELCADMNDKRNVTLCYGASFEFADEIGGNQPGCFLKNPGPNVATDGKSATNIDSAILIL